MGGEKAVGIVGVGPRGLAVLERLCANAGPLLPETAVTVHVIDPAPPGAGSVWRVDQPAELLMNTVADQVTLFTDAGVSCAGPVLPGPTLYEWAQLLAVMGEVEGYPEHTLTEARGLGRDDYPSRALYGHYLRWVFDRIVRTAPDHFAVRVHQDRAVDLRGGSGTQRLRLSDGQELLLDAVILAQGHLPVRPSPRTAALSRHARAVGARHIPPANPADVDLRDIEPQEAVALRGLGLNFFDYLALFTQGRGGTFVDRGRELEYRPSGLEPRLYAGSRRGVPHHARGANQKSLGERHRPLLLTPAALSDLRAAAASGTRGDFRRDLWPLIAREVETVYYSTLLRRRGVAADAVADFARRHAHQEAGRDALLHAHDIADADRWNWSAFEQPCAEQDFGSHEEFRDWLLDHLLRDVERARGGNTDDPVKAALDALRDLRNEIRLVVDHGGINGDSRRRDLDSWYTPLNAHLSIGPPLRRTAEMAALIKAGILRPVGPGMRVQTAPGGFLVSSARVPGPPVQVSTLIEARVPEPGVRATTDPLMRELLHRKEATTHRLTAGVGTEYDTGGLAVTRRPFHLLDARGRPHPRRFAYGVPTEGVHWATAAGARPGVDSVLLSDADAMARHVLEHVVAARVQVPESRES
ncbi:FAD/NAD(P)-binding protein [Streptomyces sp. NPDC048518]|uniref:FAD/NAD(P)-binding protein n=1 Tax=Streptomyces sp. NPDC048518 TaxID=3155029 RepID=UPI0033F6360C